MPRNSGPRGPYSTKHTIKCAWCGEHHECVKLTTQTCSGRCRSRLMRYRQRTGLDPLEPPGEQSVEEAIKELFAMLCAAERVRRVKYQSLQRAKGECIYEEIEAERRREQSRK